MFDESEPVHMLDNYQSLHKSTTTFNVRHFGELTYISASCFTSKHIVVGSTRVGGEAKTYDNAYCVFTSLWNEKVVEHGRDPRWLFTLKDSENFKAVTRRFFNWYYQGTRQSKDLEGERYQDLLTVLESGETELLVQEHGYLGPTDCLMTLQGKPLQRRLGMGYITNRLKEKHYDYDRLVPYLEQHPQVEEVDRHPIPYYNANYEGEQCVEFYFVPKDQEEFDSIFVIHEHDQTVKNLHAFLQLDQFKKNRA